MRKHKVKVHNWLNGRLSLREYVFLSLDEASEFLRNSKHHSAKIYDEEGKVVKEFGNTHETYA